MTFSESRDLTDRYYKITLKTFVIMDVRMPHKDVLLDDYIWQRVIVEFREKYPL